MRGDGLIFDASFPIRLFDTVIQFGLLLVSECVVVGRKHELEDEPPQVACLRQPLLPEQRSIRAQLCSADWVQGRLSTGVAPLTWPGR